MGGTGTPTATASSASSWVSARIQRWIANSYGWSTWRHIVVAVVLIVAAGTLASLLYPGPDAALSSSASPSTSAVEQVSTPNPEPAATAVDTPPVTEPAAAAAEAAPEPTVTATPPVQGPYAIDVLDAIPVELEHRGGYDRDLFNVWADDDQDGCNTRDEVLHTETLLPVASDEPGCIPSAGLWLSAYDNAETTDPTELDIDHLVPLKEAWDSGAWAWTPERRSAYANDLSDPRTLVAVSASSNRAKGDRDPSNWIPDDDSACQYVADWIAVKARWSMSMDQSEHGRLGNLIDDRCAGLTIEPWTIPT